MLTEAQVRARIKECKDEIKWQKIYLNYAEVIKLPWKPKKEEGYYFIDFNRMIEKVYFADDSLFDLLNYKVGNCFRPKEEAEKNKLKIYEMLNKEGVLHE